MTSNAKKWLLILPSVYTLVSCRLSWATDNHEKICEKIFINSHGSGSQNLYFNWKNPGTLLPPDHMINMAQWRKWNSYDFLKYEGQLVAFELPKAPSIRSWVIVEILSFQMLSDNDRKAVIGIYSELSRRKKENEVELGFLVINRQNNMSTNHFLNNESKHIIKLEDVLAPLRELKNDLSNIESVQFFHNHPSNGPLSLLDISAAINMSNILRVENYPSRFPVHIYSISNFDGIFVIFHYGIE